MQQWEADHGQHGEEASYGCFTTMGTFILCVPVMKVIRADETSVEVLLVTRQKTTVAEAQCKMRFFLSSYTTHGGNHELQ